MKRLLKSWVFWVFAALPVVAALLWGIHLERASASCYCGTWRVERQWAFGVGRVSVPLSPAESHVHASSLAEEVLTSAHVHAWRSGIGESSFFSLWSRKPEFRAWLVAEVRQGRLRPEEVEREAVKEISERYPFGWTP